MRKHYLLSAGLRLVAGLLFTFIFSASGFGQSGTLHLNYVSTQIELNDTSIAKLDDWVKSLNGRHVDIQVVAYFHRPEFKKFASQRADELFLILNRKARSLITITFIGPRKGENYQRSTVDVIYQPTLSPEELAAAKAKATAETETARTAEKKKKEEEKAAKQEKPAEKVVAKKEEEKPAKGKASDQDGKPVEKSKETAQDQKKDKTKKDEKESKKEEDDEEDKAVAFATVMTMKDGSDLSLEEAQYVKASKIIIGQTGDAKLDEIFLRIVKENWKLGEDISSMPYKEARKMAKANKKDSIVVLSIAQVKTWFVVKSFGYEYRVLKLGRAISLENAKGKTLYKQIVPSDKGKGIANEYMVFGISLMNSLITTMLENNTGSSAKVNFMTTSLAEELRNRRLIAPENKLHPKLPLNDISKYYSGNLEFVPEQEWRSAINQKKDVAYVMIVKVPHIDNFQWHYLMDAKTGKVYLYDRGPGFQMTMSIGVHKNLDPSQSGYIDKANLERYEKFMNGPDKAEKKGKSDKANKEKK